MGQLILPGEREWRYGRNGLTIAGLLAALLSALFIICLPWPRALLYLVVLISVIILVIRPAVGLLFLPFTVPFGFWAWTGIPFHLPDLLVLLLLFSWLLQSLARHRLGWHVRLLFWPLLILFVALGISFWYAIFPAAALPEWFKWGEVLAVYLLVVNTFPRRWLPWLVASMLTAAAPEAIVGLHQFALREGPAAFLIMGGRFSRAFGDFAQPNPFGGYLGLMLPLGAALFLWSLSECRLAFLARHGLGQAVIRSAVLLTLTGAIAAGLFASWSRGGWLAASVALLTVLLLYNRWTFWLTVGGGGLVAVLNWVENLGLLPGVILTRLGSFSDWLLFLYPVRFRATPVTDINFSIMERTAHWLAAWNMWLTHPWHGVGIGNYGIAYTEFQVSLWREALAHAHNIYLNFLAESGLIGFSAYVFLFVIAFVVGLRLLRRLRGGPSCVHASTTPDVRSAFTSFQGKERALVLGTLGLLVHLSFHNLFDNLYVHGLQLFLGIALGMFVLLSEHDACKHRDLEGTQL